MFDGEGTNPGSVCAAEQVPLEGSENRWTGLVSPGWRGRVSELGADGLGAFWVEAVAYARWEIGRYARWRGQEAPVLADGYDAEGVAQDAFERLMRREFEGVPIFYSAEEVWRELRVMIKRRVRWLSERSEARLVMAEWDVLPRGPDDELASIFDYLPGRIARPDEELMEAEKERLLGEFKAGFETSLGEKKELVKVFREVWDGQKRRRVAWELGAGVERVKALQAQVRRRMARFGAGARGGVVEMLQGVKEDS